MAEYLWKTAVREPRSPRIRSERLLFRKRWDILRSDEAGFTEKGSRHTLVRRSVRIFHDACRDEPASFFSRRSSGKRCPLLRTTCGEISRRADTARGCIRRPGTVSIQPVAFISRRGVSRRNVFERSEAGVYRPGLGPDFFGPGHRAGWRTSRPGPAHLTHNSPSVYISNEIILPLHLGVARALPVRMTEPGPRVNEKG